MLTITFRTGRQVRVKASKELAAALVIAPPDYISGLSVAGGVDDLVRSHVPTLLYPWGETWAETLSEN